MAHAFTETWHVVCVELPRLPAVQSGVTFTVHPPGTEMHRVAARLSRLRPAGVITVSATVLDVGPVRRYVRALALSTRGAVLSDPPVLWALSTERVPPLDVAWNELATAAAEGAKTLTAEREVWVPDPTDDWSSVS